MVKPVDKKLYRNYLQKAEEMLDMAQYALDGVQEQRRRDGIHSLLDQCHGRARRVLLREAAQRGP